MCGCVGLGLGSRQAGQARAGAGQARQAAPSMCSWGLRLATLCYKNSLHREIRSQRNLNSTLHCNYLGRGICGYVGQNSFATIRPV